MKRTAPFPATPLASVVVLATAATVLSGSLTGCGKGENIGFPEKPQDLPTSAFDTAAALRWKLLAKELRIDDGTRAGNEADLTRRLAGVSDYLTKTSDAAIQAEYAAKLDAAAREYAATSYKGRCASIDEVQELATAKQLSSAGIVSDFLDAKVYVMKYKLQKNTAGDAESVTRTGLLVVPTTDVSAESDNTKKYPLVAFAHSGENGLSYAEIGGLFGQLQGTHVIVAPSFPGEPICKAGVDFASTRTCDAGGKIAEASNLPREPFVTDVDEVLGMHECIVRASIGVSANLARQVIPITKQLDATGAEVSGGALQSFLANNLKRIEANPPTPASAAEFNPVAYMPVSYITGISRGGFTAQLALARAGGILSALSTIPVNADYAQKVQAVVGTKFFQPPRFSCALDLFGPSTFLATEFRVGLEAFIKGYGDKTSFALLPTGPQLNERWKAYGEGVKLVATNGKAATTDAGNAKLAADKLFKMDGPLQAPFIIAALRNWSSTATTANKRGALLFLHGLYDAVVPSSQSKLASTIYFRVGASIAANPALAAQIPGVSIDALGLQPGASFLTTDAAGKPALKKGNLQHGDRAFFTSTYSESLLQCGSGNAALDAACKQLNAKQDAGYAKATAQMAFVKWLRTDCAASTTP